MPVLPPELRPTCDGRPYTHFFPQEMLHTLHRKICCLSINTFTVKRCPRKSFTNPSRPPRQDELGGGPVRLLPQS